MPAKKFKSSLCLKMKLRAAILVLGVCLSVSQEAEAGKYSVNNFLETVGISAAVGTVLGASTLPFYQDPQNHLPNVAVGAVSGTIVGLGIWAFEKIQESNQTVQNTVVVPSFAWMSSGNNKTNLSNLQLTLAYRFP